MFHAAKGPFGMKIDFAENVTVDGVSISNIKNTGAVKHIMCDSSWKLYPSKDIIGPATSGYSGADVRGAVITKAYNVQLRNVIIDNLDAGEGRVIGLDLIGDEVGRALFFPQKVPYVSTDNVEVGGNLKGGKSWKPGGIRT